MEPTMPWGIVGGLLHGSLPCLIFGWERCLVLYHAANAIFCNRGLLWLTTDGCAGGSETEAQWLGTGLGGCKRHTCVCRPNRIP